MTGIFAAADALSGGLYIREFLKELHQLPVTEVTVDSMSLQSLSTFIKEPGER